MQASGQGALITAPYQPNVVAAREGVRRGDIKFINIKEGVELYRINIDGAGDGENSIKFKRNLARLDLIGD